MKHLMEMSVLDLNSLPEELERNSFVDSLMGKTEEQATGAKDRYMQQVLQELKKREKLGGYRNYFIPGTKYGIDKCPKHRAFFAATGPYSEVQFRAGNRCLAEGTLVKTPYGPVPIEKLVVGDLVYDINHTPTKVTAVWDNGEQDTVILESEDGQGLVECTPNHEFYAGAPGARARADSQDLHLYKYSFGLRTKYPVDVRKARPSGRRVRVYDITVEHEDHFYVLANGIITSNCGKTLGGTYAVSLWLTQEYPDWWYEIGARVFKCKTNILACGQTNESTRNIVQKEYIGELGNVGTGMIPPEYIKRCWNKPQTPGTIDTVEVFNQYGDVCLLQFKSYEQKIETYVGTARHAVHMDEEPPLLHYNECVVRTAKLANYDRRGIVINTVTPIEGVTPFLAYFDKAADHLDGAARITADE